MKFFQLLLSIFRKPHSLPASDDWLQVAQWLLESEGGYSDRSDDHGGPTNMGITIPTLSNWRGHQCTAEDIKALTAGEVLAIYHTNYWHAMRCDELPHGVDMVVMDAGVMSGQERAIRFLQEAVGVTQDGILGDVTLAAVATKSPAYIVMKISIARSNFYQSLNQPANERGWLARVDRTKIEANSLIV